MMENSRYESSMKKQHNNNNNNIKSIIYTRRNDSNDRPVPLSSYNTQIRRHREIITIYWFFRLSHLFRIFSTTTQYTKPSTQYEKREEKKERRKKIIFIVRFMNSMSSFPWAVWFIRFIVYFIRKKCANNKPITMVWWWWLNKIDGFWFIWFG